MSNMSKQLREVLEELGVEVVELGGCTPAQDPLKCWESTHRDETILEELDELVKEFIKDTTVSSGTETATEKPNKAQPKTKAKVRKSPYAAYSYDKKEAIPLPVSIQTEEQAIEYVENKGYKFFEIYKKLGTYKMETKTELVKQ